MTIGIMNKVTSILTAAGIESESNCNVGMLILGTAVLAVLLILYLHRLRSRDRKPYKLPPGPRPWPVIGNLVHLSPRLHQGFAAMAAKYGDLVYLRLGAKDAVVISSPQRAEEVLKTHDRIFAGRPQATYSKLLLCDFQCMVSSSYGPYWRHIRKIATVQLLTAKRIQSFQNQRKAHMLKTLNSVINSCEDGKATRMDEQMYALQIHNITGITLGEIFHGQDSVASTLRGGSQLMDVVTAVAELGTCFIVGDYFPLLHNFDVFGYKKRMKEVAKRSDEILEKILCEHEERRLGTRDADVDKDGQDFVDVLLAEAGSQSEQALSRFQIKALLQDILLGGMETSSTTLSWALAELLINPSIMRRAQEELDAVIGRDRLVKESDVPRLPYLRAILKETLRLHPILPLLVPHLALEACILEGGYKIPKDSLVFVNEWTMARDPNLWRNPLDFNPDRFLTEGLDYNGQSFKFFPFGSGRRICPGRHLAEVVVEYSLAAMLHACDWTLPQGMSPQDVDMQDLPGLACRKAIPLEAVASPRLPLSVIFST